MPANSKRTQVLLMAERFPNSDPEFNQVLAESFKKEGFFVKWIDASSLIPELVKRGKRRRVLVYPNSAYLPSGAQDELVNYLSDGGNLLVIGGPAFSKPAVCYNGKWMDQERLSEELAKLPFGRKLIDIEQVEPASIPRNTLNPEVSRDIRIVDSGIPDIGPVMEVDVGRIASWEQVEIPMQSSFPAGECVTTFRAKGRENSKSLIVGFTDSNGHHWKSRIPLTTSWKRYALTPDRFRLKDGGKENDLRFDPSKAVTFWLNLEGWDVNLPDQPVTYWISSVHSTPNPAGECNFDVPTLDPISPHYKTYQTQAAAYVPTFGSYKEIGTTEVLSGPIETICSVPRYRGMGFNRKSEYRWIPTLCVKMDDGHIGGAAAALYVQRKTGSVWATLGVADSAYLAAHRVEVAREAVSLVNRIESGLFLFTGGVDQASYFEQAPKAGAVILNTKKNMGSVEIRCQVRADIENAEPLFTSQQTVRLAGKQTVAELGMLPTLESGFYIAKVSMYQDGRQIDEIRQPFSVASTGPVPEDEIVTIQGDMFYYKGKPWYSMGVNYRPLYCASLELGVFTQHWANPNQYDPEIVELDIEFMKKLGLNTVGLIMAGGNRMPGFVDCMERAHRHGLKSHVYLGATHPLRPNYKAARALINGARLMERRSMFAYDVAWEVRIGREAQREGADAHWKRWLEDRYGSVENAERDWEFELRKDPDGRVHGPDDTHITTDGPWRRMVAAYRRFWDDRISRCYMEIAQFIDTLDPIHPISARSGWGGTGSLFAVPQMPFDLLSGAKHLDYISPEGYNFIGSRQDFREGGFTTLYGHFASGYKPVYWAELGSSLPCPPTEESLEKQRRFYEYIYDTFYETRAAGSLAWWWPGYLIWETTDWSFIHPDYTPRPAALEFTRMSERAQKPFPRREPDYWIEIDRDLYVTGYAGILADKRKEYGIARAEGKVVGLRTRGTGTDTSNFVKIAVGDQPLTGNNPPKYLNGEFNLLEIRNAAGKWVSVQDGETVRVKANAPVHARASLGNIGEVKWLAPGGSDSGGVFLRVEIDGRFILAPITADASFFSDTVVAPFMLSNGICGKKAVSFQLITGKYPFGEKWIISLQAG